MRYRSDIDGLRGIAVLFVLIFHGFARLLPGGFIGVDIFFVISGYLITLILFGEIIENKYSVAAFYARRIKRIFPALITVLGATCVLGWLLLFPDEFKNLGKHVTGGAAFISNILVWRETGYFDDAAERKPLLHLWSLGVEEQFYIFFPVLLWLAYRKGFATPRFFTVILALSFGLSVYGTLYYQRTAFFLPVTRFWELLIGCILAIIELERNKLSKPSSSDSVSLFSGIAGLGRPINKIIISGLGLALIVMAVACINNGVAFPGWWALLPTFGTALIIFAGGDSVINRWVLGNKLLVGIGLISYPLYLWHWPLLYFGRILSPAGMSNLTVFEILTASGLLALLTFLFVESPIRFGSILGTRKVLVLCMGMSVLLAFGFFANRRVLPSRLGLVPLSNEVVMAAQDWIYPFPDNFNRISEFKKDVEFVRGKPDQAVLFIGDSHMQYYWPRIEMVINKLQSNARPVIFITAGGSPALPNVNRITPGFACDKFFDFAMQEAAKNNVKTVVISCFWESYFGAYPNDTTGDVYLIGDQSKVPLRFGNPVVNQVFVEFGQTIAGLTKMGKEVVVILPGPMNYLWAPELISRFASPVQFTNQVWMARKDIEALIRPVKQALIVAVTSNGGKTIDPLDYFEEDGGFNGKTPQGRFRYKDSNHFRPFYVCEKAFFLDSLLRASDNPK